MDQGRGPFGFCSTLVAQQHGVPGLHIWVPRGNGALVVSSLVSFIYVRLRSSVFGSMCRRRSRTLAVFGELLS